MKFDAEFITTQLALAAKATPRPWKWNAEDGSLLYLEGKGVVLEGDEYAMSCGLPIKADADLIVSAVNGWTDALAEILSLRAAVEERDRLRVALSRLLDVYESATNPDLHHHTCAKLYEVDEGNYGDCDCGADRAIAEARKALRGE